MRLEKRCFRQRGAAAVPAGVHPPVLSELVNGLLGPLQKGDVPEGWKKARSRGTDEQGSGWPSG